METVSDYNQTFTEMVRRHEKIIFSVCFFYATGEVPFDDLRQEVLISLFGAYRNFRHESRESTWVYKVCINTCLFSLRRLSSRITTVPIEELPPPCLEDDRDCETKEKLEWLHSLISRLSPMDKALILMWLDELGYDDIAANMGIPRNTVASRLHRIKNRLTQQSSSAKEI